MPDKAKQVTVDDRQLKCHHCGRTQFYERTIAMNDAGASLFGLEWFTQRGAFCYICSKCGHVHWFMPTE
jgi:predicted nucleic-acid-binding Zn-ribbon protein